MSQDEQRTLDILLEAIRDSNKKLDDLHKCLDKHIQEDVNYQERVDKKLEKILEAQEEVFERLTDLEEQMVVEHRTHIRESNDNQQIKEEVRLVRERIGEVVNALELQSKASETQDRLTEEKMASFVQTIASYNSQLVMDLMSKLNGPATSK